MMLATLRALALALVLCAPTAALAAGEPTAGGVSAATLKLPDGPASVRGLTKNPSISAFSGQMSYSVPLDLPAAAAGFGPSMSLNYNGSLGNSVVGVGRLEAVKKREQQRKAEETDRAAGRKGDGAEQ